MKPFCEAVETSERPKVYGSTRLQIALASCACAGISAFVYAVDPNQNAVYPQCLFFATTGFYCAGCGTTRALYALLHGRLLDALHDNALFVLALPVAATLAGLYLSQAWQKNAWPEWKLQPRFLVWNGAGLLLLLLAFALLRNLPGLPFDFLKPLT